MWQHLRWLVAGAVLAAALGAAPACREPDGSAQREEEARPAEAAGPGQGARGLGGPSGLSTELVALGDFHSCRIAAGQVRCRGSNLYRQLGVAAVQAGQPSLAVPGLQDAVSVAAGAKHSCALLRDTTVHCWGLDQYGQTGHDGRDPGAVTGLRGVVALALGDEHSCGLVKSGAVLCWGRDEERQLGAAPSQRRGPGAAPPATPSLPGLLPRNDEPRVVEVVADAVQIAAGGSHSCARTADGSLWCWGDNRAGQLGTGRPSEPVRSPQRVPGIDGALYVAAGGQRTCAVLGDGSVRCWGGSTGSAAAAGPSPAPVPGLSHVRLLAVGPSMGCAIAVDGTLRCWRGGPTADGWDELGEPPGPVAGLPKAAWVVVGLTTTCAARPGGEVLCWGRNAYSMVSDAAATMLADPVPYGAVPPGAGADGGAPCDGGAVDGAAAAAGTNGAEPRLPPRRVDAGR